MKLKKKKKDLKNSIKNLFISTQTKKKTIDEYVQKNASFCLFWLVWANEMIFFGHVRPICFELSLCAHNHHLVVVKEVVVEVAEESGQDEVMVKLAGVVEGGMVVEVVVMMIMICLNIRIYSGSDYKILQSNPFKQTILQGSP